MHTEGITKFVCTSLDAEKTDFMTESCNYCYEVMPSRLKYVGTTYQRLMDAVFANQIGKNLEVCVDEMVVKTEEGQSHLDDLAEIFARIRLHNMKLNPEKLVNS